MTVTGGIERIVLAALLDTPGDHIAAAAAALRKIVMRLAAGELVGGGSREKPERSSKYRILSSLRLISWKFGCLDRSSLSSFLGGKYQPNLRMVHTLAAVNAS